MYAHYPLITHVKVATVCTCQVVAYVLLMVWLIPSGSCGKHISPLPTSNLAYVPTTIRKATVCTCSVVAYVMLMITS